MKIKDTLNLGRTKFKMRGNLPITEKEREDVWYQNDIYGERQKLNSDKPVFVLHDGPPYANGRLHMGHAMNKISKDIIVRYKSMNGYRAPYVPGWDTHGLPIEQELVKNGYDRKKMSVTAFRKLCHDYALKQVDQQKMDFKRLGILAEWDNPYLTLDPEYEAEQVKLFGKMVQEGLIYRGKKPVFWSCSSESALAEAEVEYHDVTSTSVFYAEKIIDGKGVIDNGVYMVVWTTTPWTIPASQGVTIGSDFDYVVVQPEGETRKFIVAHERLKDLKELFNWTDVSILKTVKGIELDRIKVQHPFINDRTLLVMLGSFVTLDSGTGLVHTAPGFGEDDFIVGREYNLEVLSPIDDQGYLTSEAGPDFDGIFYENANEIALKKLLDRNLILKKFEYKHSYPFDWRTKKPIIYRATPQWFASVDKIRNKILKVLDGVSFKPEWGKKRLYNMIKDRGDWVISRQRRWGVPLPIFYGEDGEPIITEETINNVTKLFKKYGSNIWFDLEAKDLLPSGFISEHSPKGEFTKETDIMDVWFDSGSSHQGVLNLRKDLDYPADLVLEGSDQYRGWFNSSLITSVAFSNKAPYKYVISQGFTLDSKGYKMSKSLGNTIVPEDIIKKMGSEIIRLWVTSVDTSSDVRVSQDNFLKIADSYKKIRNTVRYLLSNLEDYNPKLNNIEWSKLTPEDQYMLSKFKIFIRNIKNDYESYNFVSLYKTLMKFIINDLSSFYLDFAKDVIYIESPDSLKRRSMQTVFYTIVTGITKLITPILPHTSEEIWEYLKESEKFVQLSELPDIEEDFKYLNIVSKWERIHEIRNEVLKKLEEARESKLIGKSMEAHIDLYLNQDDQELIKTLKINMSLILITSTVSIHNLDVSNKVDEIIVEVRVAKGATCERCRMIKEDVGSSDNDNFKMLCMHCIEIITENYESVLKDGFED